MFYTVVVTDIDRQTDRHKLLRSSKTGTPNSNLESTYFWDSHQILKTLGQL